MQPLLKLHHIKYSYHSLNGETTALADISFDVAAGEFVAIVGPSGCGKTTLLSLLSGLLIPEEGEIIFHGNHKTGYMLQRDHLFEWRNVYQNVLLGPELNHCLHETITTYINKLLKEYGLWKFRHKRPSELSGGMKQRAALIRTLAMDPDILLLDEPFSALDFQTRLIVSKDIAQLIKNAGKTAILITHDLSEAIRLSDRIIILSSRPAIVKKEMPIHLTLTGHSALSPLRAPEYNIYFNELWEELKNEEP